MQCWLVVDDSEIVRKVARKVLEDMHYMVLEAENGAAALEICNRAMPQFILLDWLMPGMNGHEFLAALKQVSAEHRPFIVYCTTENDPIDISKAFAGGAETYVLKPFNRQILRAKISEAVMLAA